MPMIEIKLQDQFDHMHAAKAFLRQVPVQVNAQYLAREIEHVVIGNEIIIPSIELLFESHISKHIYRLVD